MDLVSDNVYWQVTSNPRMRSPNSINFIMGDLVGKRSIVLIVIIGDRTGGAKRCDIPLLVVGKSGDGCERPIANCRCCGGKKDVVKRMEVWKRVGRRKAGAQVRK